jgi:hypothetical protein
METTLERLHIQTATRPAGDRVAGRMSVFHRALAALQTGPFDGHIDDWERSLASKPRRLDATL